MTDDLILSYIKKIQEDIEFIRRDSAKQIKELEETVLDLKDEIRNQSTRMLRHYRQTEPLPEHRPMETSGKHGE